MVPSSLRVLGHPEIVALLVDLLRLSLQFTCMAKALLVPSLLLALALFRQFLALVLPLHILGHASCINRLKTGDSVVDMPSSTLAKDSQ